MKPQHALIAAVILTAVLFVSHGLSPTGFQSLDVENHVLDRALELRD